MNTARPAPASGLIVAPGRHAADAHELVEVAKQILERAVIAERMRGTDWQTIGDALAGITRSAAHDRFSAAVRAFQTRTEQGRQLHAEAGLDEAWERVTALAERRSTRAEILRVPTGDEQPTCACGAPAVFAVGYHGETESVLQCVRCATADRRSPFFHRPLTDEPWLP